MKNKEFLKYLFQNDPIHLGPSEYACPVCSKIMRSRAEVIRHIRVHTGEKPFTCNKCNFKTSQKASLLAHLKSRRHLETNPYEYA